MSLAIVPTGVSGLDTIIHGGFPRNSLILVAGNPGTGKTNLSAQFIYRGIVDYNENGVYVSFSEDRTTFYENMKMLGFDFEKLENDGRFRYLDFLAVKEDAVPSVLKSIIEEVNNLKAKRLVIDSWTVLAQAFENPFETRIVIHSILSRITREAGCTTIVIVEIPFGSEKIGLGMEEFVADSIILLQANELNDRLYRNLVIKKMRGKKIHETKIGFTFHNELKAALPFKEALPKNFISKITVFKPIPDSPELFSTGASDLDQLFSGGYSRGSSILFEIGANVSIPQYHLLLAPTAWNFASYDRGIMIVPSSGVDYTILFKQAKMAGYSDETINRLLRVCTFRSSLPPTNPCIIEFDGRDIESDFQKYINLRDEIHKTKGQPLLHIIGIDKLITHYSVNDALKVLNSSVTMARQRGDLCIFVLKPCYYNVSDVLSSFADIHLKIIREHGAILVFGVKPRTHLNFVELDLSKGYPLPKLTPIL
ncbi:hypothetical protein KEJ18_04990 [Candidatus Bathyarchaeota archaeon]|nr:hypothetical protein [Candidatus Bathyarchaeota archaeon]